VRGSKNFSEYNYRSHAENGWKSQASCRNVDTSIFFSTSKSEDITKAKRICSSCPVSAYCLYSALQYQYQGVWGNTTEEERNYITKVIYKNDVSNVTLEHCKVLVGTF
jgi:WhiB family redox-sensing transcriptional regulator